MLGFEHPSHMVTHPSTDEAQCCLSLEILVNSTKKEESKIKFPSELRRLIKCKHRKLQKKPLIIDSKRQQENYRENFCNVSL